LGGELVEVGVGDAYVDDVRAYVRYFGGEVVSEGALDREVPLLDVAGACGAICRVDALAEAGVGCEGDGRYGWSVGEREGCVDAVSGLLLDVLDEGELRGGEGCRDSGLVDENYAEAGAYYGLRCEEIGEAYARGYVGEVKLAGAAGVSVYAKVVELLRGEVEDCALVVLFGGGEVQGPAGSEI
jgi:hypothetical protein